MDETLRTMDVDTAVRLLAEHEVGRLALNDPAGPLVVPVNYRWESGTVAVRTDLGTRLSAAEAGLVASFQLDHADPVARVGWSVLVRGRLREVVDPDELERLDGVLPEPYTRGAGRRHVVRLLPSAITGRAIPLPGDVPGGWYRAAVLGSSAFTEERS